MTGTLSPTATRPTELRTSATEGEEPGWGESVNLMFRSIEDDLPHVQEKRKYDGYRELSDALLNLNLGYKADDFTYHGTGTTGVPNTEAIWQAVETTRRRYPGSFKRIPGTREEYEQWLYNRRGEADREEIDLSRGPLSAKLLGGAAASMTDPVNILTMPLGGGGKTLLQAALRAGATNAAVETVQTPILYNARQARGKELTLQEAGLNILFAGVGGAAIGGGTRGLGMANDVLTDSVRGRFERYIADNWDRLPEPVRAKMTKGARIGDANMVDVAEAVIGRVNMSPEERAAADAVRRSAEIEARSPFKPGMAGDAAHRQMFDARLSELLQPVERQVYRATVPVAPSRAELGTGTNLSTGAPPAGARAALKAKIRRAESGGDDAAKNPLSSATGRYQFTRGTWLTYYKRRFGAQGLSDDQIAAKRGDGRLQETLMDDLTADNAAFLRGIGEAESAGNLYLTHFAGTGGARKLFAADPAADAGAVLGASVVRSNPWLRGMSAGDVIAWAHRKMNEAPPARSGARAELADDGGALDAVAAVQAEIDRLSADTMSAQATRDAESEARIAAALDEEPTMVEIDADELARIAEAPGGRDTADMGLSDRELALLPGLRSEIAGTARLSDIDGLAARLEASADEVRRAMQAIAAREKGMIVQRSDGSFRRVASDRGPVDAYKFLSRAGGIADDEGHELIERFGVGARTERTDGLTGKRVAGQRRQSVMIPGAGPLVRQSGMSIDAAGERLFEAGYLRGAEGGRPTTAETIAYLERGMEGADTRRAMVPEDRLSEVDAYVAPQTLSDMTDYMREWAATMAPDLDADDVDQLARLMLRGDIENEAAAAEALWRGKVLDALDDARYEDGRYDADLAQFLDDYGYGADRGRSDADAGDAGEGAGRAADDDGPVDVEGEAGRQGWDRVDDAQAVATADSVSHDLNALYGEDGIDPDLRFFVDDEGEARNWADVAAELDIAEAEIKAIRDCL